MENATSTIEPDVSSTVDTMTNTITTMPVTMTTMTESGDTSTVMPSSMSMDMPTVREATGLTTTNTTLGPEPDNLALILGCSIGGAALLILIIILITYCVLKVKKKRAFEGKYSPSANEQKGGVPMNDILNVMQPPLPERLI